MDENGKTIDEGQVGRGTKTMRSDHAKGCGRDWRKHYRWKTHRADNSGSRPRKLPLSDHVLALMSMRLPEFLRTKLERNIGGQQLPETMTFAEGLAFGEMCAPFFNGFKVDGLSEIRKTTEGREGPRVCEPVEQELEEKQSGVEEMSLRDRVMLDMLKMMKERKEIYGLEMPKFEADEREALEEIRKAESRK